jgi:hypothetical protein
MPSKPSSFQKRNRITKKNTKGTETIISWYPFLVPPLDRETRGRHIRLLKNAALSYSLRQRKARGLGYVP